MKLNVLRAIWGTQTGYVFVPRRKGKTWDEGRGFKYPDEWPEIETRLQEANNDGWDTYWCPLLFDKPSRKKENVKPEQGILWADLDEVDPKTLNSLKPSVAWASSSDRYQGLWILDSMHDIDEVEEINKALTYHIGADKSGWDVTQILRVPGSINHKYNPPQPGRMLWAEKRIYVLDKVRTEVAGTKATPEAVPPKDALSVLLTTWPINGRLKDLLTVNEAEVQQGERSDRLWEIETSLVELGVPLMDIVDIIMESPWNKFKGRRDEAQQIYNEILKADKHVKVRMMPPPVLPTPAEDRIKDQMWAIPFDTFVSTKMEPPTWLIDQIWQKGTYGMIAGEPKTYKSVQATDMALSVASGRPYLGQFKVNHPGPVLYIQEENNAQTVQDRVVKTAFAKGLMTSTPGGLAMADDIPLYFCNNYGVNLTEIESRDLVEATIKQIKPVMVILDPLYMMFGSVDENSAKEVGEVLRWLTYLRNQYGIAIVICHHYNKGGTNARGGQRVRGSSAFHAWVESAMYIKATTELYTVKIEREFRAYPTSEELVMKVDMGEPGDLHYKIVLSNDAEEPTTREHHIESILNTLSGGPRTATDLKELVKLSRRDLMDLLKELTEIGMVHREEVNGEGGRGRRAVYMLDNGMIQRKKRATTKGEETDEDDDEETL